jgi:4-carboxymuconolactone decarboxylase
VALIEYVDDEVYTSILGSDVTATLLRAIFHAPPFAQAFVKLGVTTMSSLELAPLEREIVMLRSAFRYSAPYVWGMHEGVATKLGLSSEKLAAVRTPLGNDGILDRREVTLVKLVDALCDSAPTTREAIQSAKEFWSTRELIEIIGVHGVAYIIAKITVPLEIELDPVLPGDMKDFIDAASKS